MKNVVIFYGTGESSGSFWYPWIKGQLEKNGYVVSIPELPDSNHPSLDTWLPVALKETYTNETVIVSHSAGTPLMLSVLENIATPVNKIISVAGFINPFGDEVDKILQSSYNWDKINNNVKDVIVINSDNDPWGCTDEAGKEILDNIGKGILVVPKGEGHMGSESFNQPYKEFPLLLKLIL